jgi:NhaC family Na+:H+ antiporter
MAADQTAPRAPSLGLALVPVVLTLLVLALQLFYFDDFTPHIPLAIGLAITGLVGLYLGHKWPSIDVNRTAIGTPDRLARGTPLVAG